MLNEIKEYSLYLTKGYGKLIYNPNLSDKLKGIRAVLTLLARGFLDDCYNDGVDSLETQHWYTVAFLQTWLIGERVTELSDERINNALNEIRAYPTLQQKLDLAKEANLLDYMIAENIKIKDDKSGSLEDYLKSRIMAWSSSMFYSSSKQSLNAVYFKSIIADALELGPLTDNVLVYRKKLIADFGSKDKYFRSHMVMLLGVTAVYLQKKNSTQKSVPISLAQISNYLGKPCNKDSSKVFTSISPFIDYSGYTFLGRPILVKRIMANSCTKLTVDEFWLEHYGIRLVPANTRVLPGYAKFDDTHIFQRLERDQETIR